MKSDRERLKAVRYAVCTALAAALVAGCAAGGGSMARSGSSAKAAARADSNADKAVAAAERAVERSPQDASLRAALANDYLLAGRFASAATTFEDAIALGDNSPRTALAVSLAYIGAGRNAEALTMLDQWRDSIPASDFGLALALAGETTRGVDILSDALRSGEGSAKLRQNLAYAYALDGRWPEARIMAAQDVPAGQLDARISEWAMQGRPEDGNKRIAGLLGAPVRADAGQPVHLALSSTGSSSVAAFSAPATAAAELPAIEDGDNAANRVEAFATAEETVRQPVTVPFASAGGLPDMAPAEEAFAAPASNPAPRAAGISRAVTVPVPRAQPAPTRTPAISTAPAQDALGRPGNPAECTHLVQLGSFSSPENARRAWQVYMKQNPALRDEDKRISEAVVRGKKYWRVAAAGFDQRSANLMCSSVKGRGGSCIAYSESRPLPGVQPNQMASGPMRARR